jgi:uncharacterized protein (UPF0548 family)
MLSVRRPDIEIVHRLAEASAGALPTFGAFDDWATDEPPRHEERQRRGWSRRVVVDGARFRHDRSARTVGTGPAVFDRARGVLDSWGLHLGAGMETVPASCPVEAGRTVLVVTRRWPLWVAAPCRIVDVRDQADRLFSFTYATLPSHPERGAERFSVGRDEDDAVWARVEAVWRIADPLARLGGPVTRSVQSRATAAYLRALETAVRP